jgi:hypothetical protein
MATTHPLTPTVHLAGHAGSGHSGSGHGGSGQGGSAVEQAGIESHSSDQSLVASPLNAPFQATIALTPQIARLPVEVEVSVPVNNFRVRNLLALEPSHLIESGWAQGEDMPLSAGVVQLAWSEFEVVDTQLAVRVTRMA